jgi:hypothetical protein
LSGRGRIGHLALSSYPLRLRSSQVSSRKLAGAPPQNTFGVSLRSNDLRLSQLFITIAPLQGKQEKKKKNKQIRSRRLL